MSLPIVTVSLFGRVDITSSNAPNSGFLNSNFQISFGINQAKANCWFEGTVYRCDDSTHFGGWGGWTPTDNLDDVDNDNGNEPPDVDAEDGGSSGNGDSAEEWDLAGDELTAAIAVSIQVKAALNALLVQPGLNSTQIAKINKLVNGMNDLISAFGAGNGAVQALLAGSQREAALAAIGLIGSIVGGAAAATLGGPAIMVLAAGVVGSIAAEELFYAVEEFIEEFDSATIGDVIDDYFNEIYCAALGPLCDLQVPPIILDIDGSGVEFVIAKNSNARVDIDSDGYEEKVSWIKPTAGILVIDHNFSGNVDEITEFSFASFAGHGASDLDGLKTFDENNDGVFDSKDASFSQVYIWIDKNSNAKDDGELIRASDFGLQSISLQSVSSFEVVNESVIVSKLSYSFIDDNEQIIERDAFDVMFYGNVNSGRKVHLGSNGNKIIEHENGKYGLNLSGQLDSNIELGYDKINGRTNFDYIFATNGDDTIINYLDKAITIRGRKGDDVIEGGSFNDRLRGGAGNDKVKGKEGDDIIIGGAGIDRLFGGRGDDKIRGGKGPDLINGGLGNDILRGDNGRDTFIVGEGHDLILDFDIQKDTFEFKNQSIADSASDFSIRATDVGVVVKISDSASVTFKGLSLVDIESYLDN